MLNKFEAIGIGLSVLIMGLALFLLRLETNPTTSLVNSEQQAAVVVVSQENGGQALESAIADAVDRRGQVERLVVNDVVLGTGDEVAVGDTVSVHYVGTLRDGQEFDNSRNRGQAFTFTVGRGQVIPGWEQGIVGMKVGGQRILVIPPDLAYGNQAVGPIPRNATLVFSIELVEIK